MNRPELQIEASAAPDDNGRLEIVLTADADRHEVYYESGDIRLAPTAEALLAGALQLGMLWGRDLVLHGHVSRRFLESLQVIQDIYHCWHPPLQKIGIKGVTPVNRGPRGARVGLFFSGGVDSFYSLLKHADEITDLILIRGFEFSLDDHAMLERASQLVRGVGARCGLRVIEVETNLRPVLVRNGLRWGPLAGGPVTASTGLLLQEEFKRLYIASSDPYAELTPWASHPILDPLWSTDGLEFIHDGAEATRLDKLKVLAQHDWVLQRLHVCNESPPSALNCGRCEKCIRTMLELTVVGALERGPTFETGFEAARIAQVRFPAHRRLHYVDILAFLSLGGHPRQLIRAVQTTLNRAERRTVLRAFLQGLSPGLYSLAGRGYRASKALRGQDQVMPKSAR